jgi:hypothetical protein
LDRSWAALASLALAAFVWPAYGHVVLGTPTLHLLTVQSDFIARVRIVDPEAEVVLTDPPLRQAVVVARVLETLKGATADDPSADLSDTSTAVDLRFVQQGHGVVTYAKGEEVIVFASRITRSSELSQSRIAEHVQWFSQQESGAKYVVDAGNRDAIASAVRSYVALEGLPPAARQDGLRRLTAEHLASPHEVLASSALRDLVIASDFPLFSKADLVVLEPVLASTDTPIGIRIGLLAELERRGLVFGPPRWAELLRTSTGADRQAVVRAVAAHPSEPVALELSKLLASSDPLLVSSAAVSIGSRGNDAAVAPLSKLLEAGEPRVRMAAIRGLGKVGSPRAKKVLAEAASSHPDAATRRRAAAEVVILGGGAD